MKSETCVANMEYQVASTKSAQNKVAAVASIAIFAFADLSHEVEVVVADVLLQREVSGKW